MWLKKKQKKVFITRKIPDIARIMLEKAGFEISGGKNNRPLSEKALIRGVKNCDAVLCLLHDKIHKGVFGAMSEKTKIVANFAVGFDNIDLKEAKERGISVTNTPGVSNTSVAEHALTLMLTVFHRVVEADAFMRTGKFAGWDPNLFEGANLSGKIIGIVGLGRIGQEMGKMARYGFGARLIYTDIARNKEFEKECNAHRVSFKTLLKKSDIVSLHVPLIRSTHHLMGAREFGRMKQDSVLINTSRGPVVNEKALVHALVKKQIKGAGIDVYEHEPKLTAGMRGLRNLVMTPHIASSTKETRQKMAELAAKNIIAVLNGKNPISPVL